MVKLLIALAHICVVAGQWHIGSVSEWGEAGSLSLDVPSGAQADDLLVLTVQRTDDFLVTKMLGWTRAASCYKTNNGQSRCLEAQDCPSSQVIKDEDLGYEYCRNWGDKGNGRDLATIMLMRKRSSFSGSTVNIDMRGSHPSWATLTVLRGVDAAVRSSEGASCDRVRQSKFPSVSGKTGDVLLLSMGFDDTTRYEKFQAPSSTQKLDFVWGDDEAGGLYGYQFSSDKASGTLTTGGEGASNCKDVLISLVLKGSGSVTTNPNPPSGGGTGILVKSNLGTCNAYCQSQGQGVTCEQAWEDWKNSCKDFRSVEACGTNIRTKFSGTSDMCCKCSKPVPSDACNGKVLTKTVAEHKTCNNYCASVDKQCAGAWEDNKNECNSIKATETCNTNFDTKYSGTSDMICLCVAKGSSPVISCEDDAMYKNELDETCASFANKDCASSALTEDERADLSASCPKSCGFCAQSTTQKAVLDPDCSTADWPDRVPTNTSCGLCKTPVMDMTPYKGLCSEYCKSVGKACLSAWAWDEDPCNGTSISCDRLPPYDTDTGCECGLPVSPKDYEGVQGDDASDATSTPVLLAALSVHLLSLFV